MNHMAFGNTLSRLRKRKKLTQSALADQLNISDKSVSKWETGAGYPDITLLPQLAHILGTTVDYMLSQLQRHQINTSSIRVTDASPTSFTDVMSLPGGERTFFHVRGANALFSPEDIDVSTLTCQMLHIGYILLLDRFDASDEEYGTAMARFLHQVQQAGIKTSIDVVSDSSGDFAAKVIPALPYCDYVIINEI